jgi:hypothetical protein
MFKIRFVKQDQGIGRGDSDHLILVTLLLSAKVCPQGSDSAESIYLLSDSLLFTKENYRGLTFTVQVVRSYHFTSFLPESFEMIG